MQYCRVRNLVLIFCQFFLINQTLPVVHLQKTAYVLPLDLCCLMQQLLYHTWQLNSESVTPNWYVLKWKIRSGFQISPKKKKKKYLIIICFILSTCWTNIFNILGYIKSLLKLISPFLKNVATGLLENLKRLIWLAVLDGVALEPVASLRRKVEGIGEPLCRQTRWHNSWCHAFGWLPFIKENLSVLYFSGGRGRQIDENVRLM